jgi:hypothetical protein
LPDSATFLDEYSRFLEWQFMIAARPFCDIAPILPSSIAMQLVDTALVTDVANKEFAMFSRRQS